MTETRPGYQARRAILPVVSDAEYLRAVEERIDRMDVYQCRAEIGALTNVLFRHPNYHRVIRGLVKLVADLWVVTLDGGKDGD